MGIKEWWHEMTHQGEPKTANEAFRITKFGQKVTDDMLFETALGDIHSLMSSKMLNKSYSLVYDLDEDFPSVSEGLVAYFNERQYKAFVLDSKLLPGFIGACLFISWKQETGK